MTQLKRKQNCFYFFQPKFLDALLSQRSIKHQKSVRTISNIISKPFFPITTIFLFGSTLIRMLVWH